MTSALSRSRSNLLRTTADLALRAYRRDHGAAPKSPADLIPAYLSEIPADPTDGRPLITFSSGEGRLAHVFGSDNDQAPSK